MTPERKKLGDLQAEAMTGDGIQCPQCHCRDFRTYRTAQGLTCVVRYKLCRHCGHKVITSTEKPAERIIRDVKPHDSLKLA